MRLAFIALSLVSSGLLVGCDNGPSESEAQQMFASASVSMSTAHSRATADANGSGTFDFSGPCALGGTVGVSGTYDTANGQTFDMTAAFADCNDVQGKIDGSMHWTSTVDAQSVSTAMTGELAFDNNDSSFSCAFDVRTTVSQQTVSYSGKVCDYEVNTLVTVGR